MSECPICRQVNILYEYCSPSYSYRCYECDVASGNPHAGEVTHVYVEDRPCQCGRYGTRKTQYAVLICAQCAKVHNLEYTISVVVDDTSHHTRVRPCGKIGGLARRISCNPHGYISFQDKLLPGDTKFGDTDIVPGSTLVYSHVFQN